MIAVAAALPGRDRPDRPPIILVHGAANSARVWTYWQRALADRGWPSYAIDLRGHGDSDPAGLARTSMRDYADDLRAFVAQLREPPLLAGWSMGGLVAMMAAASGGVAACVGLAPSRPERERDASKPLREGEFGPEEYGITSLDPDAPQPSMPDLDREERAIALASLCRDSRLARDERAAGIVIETLACPLLIVTGTEDRQWPRSRYADLPLTADFLEVEGASHWGLVLNRHALARAVPAVIEWVERTLP